MNIYILVFAILVFLVSFYKINIRLLKNDQLRKYLYYFQFLSPLLLTFIYILILPEKGYDKLDGPSFKFYQKIEIALLLFFSYYLLSLSLYFTIKKSENIFMFMLNFIFFVIILYMIFYVSLFGVGSMLI